MIHAAAYSWSKCRTLSRGSTTNERPVSGTVRGADARQVSWVADIKEQNVVVKQRRTVVKGPM